MEPLFTAYLDRLQELHNEIGKSLEGLPPEALDWIPGPDMNSLAVLVTHLTGAERYWVGDIAAGEPSHRIRAEEFRITGLNGADLAGKLSATLAYIRSKLETLTIQSLGESRSTGRGGEESTAGWAILHALEHTALHTGQIQLTRQLWDQAQNRGE